MILVRKRKTKVRLRIRPPLWFPINTAKWLNGPFSVWLVQLTQLVHWDKIVQVIKTKLSHNHFPTTFEKIAKFKGQNNRVNLNDANNTPTWWYITSISSSTRCYIPKHDQKRNALCCLFEDHKVSTKELKLSDKITQNSIIDTTLTNCLISKSCKVFMIFSSLPIFFNEEIHNLDLLPSELFIFYSED